MVEEMMELAKPVMEQARDIVGNRGAVVVWDGRQRLKRQREEHRKRDRSVGPERANYRRTGTTAARGNIGRKERHENRMRPRAS